MITGGMTVIEQNTMESIQSMNQKMPEVTLRDMFAMNAMNGILNDHMRTAVDDILRNDEKDKDFWTERIAAASYKMADAMIKARKEK